MKSKLLVLALSMFVMAFVVANDADDSVAATEDAIEVSEDQEVAVADNEVEEAEEAVVHDKKSCKFCR